MESTFLWMEEEPSLYKMNIESSLQKISLRLVSNSDKLHIKSVFSLTDRGNVGLMFIGFVGLAIILFITTQSTETWVVILFIVIGALLMFASILGILKQTYDFLEVTNKQITFSNSLVKRTFVLEPDFKIKMDSSIEKIKRKGRPASYFCLVELYLKTNKGKYRILDFERDKRYKEEVKELGKEIKKMIKERFPTV